MLRPVPCESCCFDLQHKGSTSATVEPQREEARFFLITTVAAEQTE